MVDNNCIIEGNVKFRDGKKVCFFYTLYTNNNNNSKLMTFLFYYLMIKLDNYQHHNWISFYPLQ